ncbi:MAG: hypothetical protein J6V66_00290, partial [Clostridia bacterium]|nr:hypothetical protein [Clostridia bacterium]
ENIKTDAATAITETKSDFYELLSREIPKFTSFPEDHLCVEYKGCEIYSGHGEKTTVDREVITNPIKYYYDKN